MMVKGAQKQGRWRKGRKSKNESETGRVQKAFLAFSPESSWGCLSVSGELGTVIHDLAWVGLRFKSALRRPSLEHAGCRGKLRQLETTTSVVFLRWKKNATNVLVILIGIRCNLRLLNVAPLCLDHELRTSLKPGTRVSLNLPPNLRYVKQFSEKKSSPNSNMRPTTHNTQHAHD